MQSKFDTQAYINKLEFCPVHETADKNNKLISSEKLPSSVAVAHIAISAREVSAAAIHSLDFSKPASIDTDLLDGAVACLEAVLSKKGALSHEHIAQLAGLVDRLKALGTLNGTNDLKTAIESNPKAFKALRQDLFKVLLEIQLLHGKTDKYAQLIEVIAILGSVLSDLDDAPAAHNEKTPALPGSEPTAELAASMITQLRQTQAALDNAINDYKSGPQHHLVRPEVIEAFGRQFSEHVDHVQRVYSHEKFKQGEQ